MIWINICPIVRSILTRRGGCHAHSSSNLGYDVAVVIRRAVVGQASSPVQTTRAPQSGGDQSKLMNQKQKDGHQLNRMMDQRDWDHRKAGRDWKMRGEHQNLGH